jgi:hypothetical protein
VGQEPKGVSARPSYCTNFLKTATNGFFAPHTHTCRPLVKNSCQMMSAATFFGLKGPKAPFFWARFPRFGGCAIPARAVFCHFWAFIAKKLAIWGLSIYRRGPGLGGRPRGSPRPRFPFGGPGTQGSSRQAVIWTEFLTSGLLGFLCTAQTHEEAAGQK